MSPVELKVPSGSQDSYRESALKTYLHLAAYAIPASSLVIFHTLVLMPRLEYVWRHVGERTKGAEWVLGLCELFTANLNLVTGAAVGVFILLEKTWARWPAVRSRVVRTFTWVLMMFMLVGVTWTCSTALLAVPMALSKDKVPEQKAEASP